MIKNEKLTQSFFYIFFLINKPPHHKQIFFIPNPTKTSRVFSFCFQFFNKNATFYIRSFFLFHLPKQKETATHKKIFPFFFSTNQNQQYSTRLFIFYTIIIHSNIEYLLLFGIDLVYWRSTNVLDNHARCTGCTQRILLCPLTHTPFFASSFWIQSICNKQSISCLLFPFRFFVSLRMRFLLIGKPLRLHVTIARFSAKYRFALFRIQKETASFRLRLFFERNCQSHFFSMSILILIMDFSIPAYAATLLVTIILPQVPQ